MSLICDASQDSHSWTVSWHGRQNAAAFSPPATYCCHAAGCGGWTIVSTMVADAAGPPEGGMHRCLLLSKASHLS